MIDGLLMGKEMFYRDAYLHAICRLCSSRMKYMGLLCTVFSIPRSITTALMIFLYMAQYLSNVLF